MGTTDNNLKRLDAMVAVLSPVNRTNGYLIRQALVWLTFASSPTCDEAL